MLIYQYLSQQSMNDEQRKAMFAKQGSKGHGISSGIRVKSDDKKKAFVLHNLDKKDTKRIKSIIHDIDPSGDFHLVGKPWESHIEIYLKTGNIRDDNLPEYYPNYYRFWLKDIIKPNMSDTELKNVLKEHFDWSVKNIKKLGMGDQKWSFTVKEEGSLHESPYYATKEKAEKEAKKYLASSDGRYAFPETLVISKN